MKTMGFALLNDWFKGRDFNEGYQEGIKVQEDTIKRIVKHFERDLKRSLFLTSTTTTASTHQCNCDCCKIDEKSI